MIDYFKLQLRIAMRKMKEFGINPLLGFLVLIALTIVGSEYVFSKTNFAPWLIIFVVISIQLRFSETKRIEFLLLTFGQRRTFLLRLVENLLSAILFIIILIVHQAYIQIIILLIISTLIASGNYNYHFQLTIPTPFSRRPFEFTTGFRRTFYLYIFAYLLTGMGVMADNYNLAVFSLLLCLLVSMSFYLKPENEFYIWIYNQKPIRFLLLKIRTGIFHATIIIVPVLLTLLITYPLQAATTLLFAGLGLAFVSTIIVAKYSAYPNEINIPEVVLLVVCMYSPYLLVVIMPYFFYKSVRKLNRLLV